MQHHNRYCFLSLLSHPIVVEMQKKVSFLINFIIIIHSIRFREWKFLERAWMTCIKLSVLLCYKNRWNSNLKYQFQLSRNKVISCKRVCHFQFNFIVHFVKFKEETKKLLTEMFNSTFRYEVINAVSPAVLLSCPFVHVVLIYRHSYWTTCVERKKSSFLVLFNLIKCKFV